MPPFVSKHTTTTRTVGTSATLLTTNSDDTTTTGDGRHSHRIAIVVQNNGASPIFIGGSGVTTATGISVPAAASFTVSEAVFGKGAAIPALFAIHGTGGISVNVLETFL